MSPPGDGTTILPGANQFAAAANTWPERRSNDVEREYNAPTSLRCLHGWSTPPSRPSQEAVSTSWALAYVPEFRLTVPAGTRPQAEGRGFEPVARSRRITPKPAPGAGFVLRELRSHLPLKAAETARLRW